MARLAVTSDLRPSKGVHIILPFDKLPVTSAVLIPSKGEDRFLFVIPWHGRTLVGTTDSDYNGDYDDPDPTEEEISQLVESVAEYFPGSELNREDVISAFAGLRPLVGGGGASTKDLSRKEKIFEGCPNLISVIGGKLTTYRRISERVVDLVSRKLSRSAGGSKTREIHLAGGPIADLELNDRVLKDSTRYGLDKETIANLITDYGGYYQTVLDIAESEGLASRLADELTAIEAEAVYSGRYEMASRPDDFLARRSRVALLLRDHGDSSRARVAALLQSEPLK
jgi:glycerol-3-phosphate dehydrogenase